MLGLKTFGVWFEILLALAISGEALSAQEQRSIAPADYRIGIGDVLQINVWKHPEITRAIPVRPDGRISLPSINDVKVFGLSTMELARLLRDKLKEIIPSPQVAVTVSPHGTKDFSPAPAVGPLKVSPPVSPDLKQRCCVT